MSSSFFVLMLGKTSYFALLACFVYFVVPFVVISFLLGVQDGTLSLHESVLVRASS